MAELASGGAVQRFEQAVQQLEVALSHRWELQQHRAEPVAHRRDALCEQVRQPDAIERISGVGQAAVRLHAEAKAGWRAIAPSLQSGRGWRSVEAAVQLHAVEPARVVLEHADAGEIRRVEAALPGRVAES